MNKDTDLARGHPQVKPPTVYSYEEEMQRITLDEGINFEDFMFT